MSVLKVVPKVEPDHYPVRRLSNGKLKAVKSGDQAPAAAKASLRNEGKSRKHIVQLFVIIIDALIERSRCRAVLEASIDHDMISRTWTRWTFAMRWSKKVTSMSVGWARPERQR